MGIKALTLHQPHASLVAAKVKTIETRSWATKYRGPLVICAAARKPPMLWSQDVIPAVADPIPMSRYWDVQEDWNNPGQYSYRWVGPLGAALVTCRVADCVPMLDVLGTENHPGPWLEIGRSLPYLSLWRGPGREVAERVDDQLPYGQFEVGRFAWLLADVVPLPEPIPVRGRLGLWSSAELDAALGRTA